MNSPSVDITAMLEADSNVDTTNYPVYRGLLPAEPIKCVVIKDFASGAPQLTMDKSLYIFATVQIRVRSSDYDEGWEQLNSIVQSLHGRAHEMWNGTYYSVITCLNGPGLMEREEQRSVFIANFNLQRR